MVQAPGWGGGGGLDPVRTTVKMCNLLSIPDFTLDFSHVPNKDRVNVFVCFIFCYYFIIEGILC